MFGLLKEAFSRPDYREPNFRRIVKYLVGKDSILI
jgi:hypothetical protein